MTISLKDSLNVTVVIDVFRAFTTASYVLDRSPATYAITTKTEVISRLALNLLNPLVIGKPEKGTSFTYSIPNSPTRVQEVPIANRHILHRTEAGARGILFAKEADLVLAAGFVNAGATAKYIKTLQNPKVTLLPMGHEATTPSLEDELCATYINSLLNEKKMAVTPFFPQIKEGPGQYFFSEDQQQYPQEDFERCLKIDCFDFAIQALVNGDYAILKRCN